MASNNVPKPTKASNNANMAALAKALDNLKVEGIEVTVKVNQEKKVLNPKTNRWVKVDGAIGKAILGLTPEEEKPATKPIRTTSEWAALGGYTLATGEEVQVQGTKPTDIYVVKRSDKVPCSVYCSCPAWKFQKLTPVLRTCKHCQAVCGIVNEAKRVAANADEAKKVPTQAL